MINRVLGIWRIIDMKKKRLIRYVLIFAAAILTSFLLPVLIRAGTTLLISRIEKSSKAPDLEGEEAIAEPNSQTGPYSLEGMTEAQNAASTDGRDRQLGVAERGNDITAGENADTNTGKSKDEDKNTKEKSKEQENKEAVDRALSEYEASFHPKVDGTKSGLYEIFIADREAAFLRAVADFLYPVYGSSVNVSRIEIADFISDDESQMTCQILLYARTRGNEDLAFYYAAYNKRYDFYSIYAYHE